jgi:TRAP-type C4-dicarboxylate transport system substrate-binding protein
MMMREAALHAAREERVESLEDTRLAMEQCAEHGITVHEWSQEETDRMKSMTSGIHDKYENVLGAGLIDRIKRA